MQFPELGDGQQLRAFERREGHDVDLQPSVRDLGQRRIQVDVFDRRRRHDEDRRRWRRRRVDLEPK